MNYPPPKPLTFEEAQTGKEDGEWVEMRGFVRSVVSEGDWCWIFVTTPSGDFAGHLQNPVTFTANPGSLIRVHGVCETQAGTGDRAAAITLQIPFLHDITVEGDAPAELFDLPLRHAADLEEMSAGQDMLRVRVVGTVLFAIAGQRIYLDDAGKGLLLLSHENLRLVPGDRIEAVGILGREGARTILREAACRRLGSGPRPEPITLQEARPLVPAEDYRLVRLRGTLIELVRSAGHTRLTLHQGDTYFDVAFDHLAGAGDLDLPLGAGLEVDGHLPAGLRRLPPAPRLHAPVALPADIVVAPSPGSGRSSGRSVSRPSSEAPCCLASRGSARCAGGWPADRADPGQMEEHARLEAEVQRAARLEALGRLAGGIAHDYNNLLTVIMGNLSLMKLNPLVMGAEEEQVREIEKGTLRARELTRRLLTFSEGGEPMRTSVDLAALVREASARASDGKPGRCVCEIASDLRPAKVDPEQIGQALQILVRHALKAMPATGAVRITLTNADVERGSHTLSPGAYLKLTVADTGEASRRTSCSGSSSPSSPPRDPGTASSCPRPSR